MVEWSVLRRREVILLMVEWFTALLVFACMASQSGYSDSSEFQFLVAVGVLVWLFSMLLTGLYLAGNFTLPPLFEGGAYALFGFLSFVGFIAGAAECSRSESPCKQQDVSATDAKASIAFSFFLVLELGASAAFAYLNHRSGGGMGLVAPTSDEAGGFARAGAGGPVTTQTPIYE